MTCHLTVCSYHTSFSLFLCLLHYLILFLFHCSTLTWRQWPGRTLELPGLYPQRLTSFLCALNQIQPAVIMNSTKKVRLTGNQSKCGLCHFSLYITLIIIYIHFMMTSSSKNVPLSERSEKKKNRVNSLFVRKQSGCRWVINNYQIFEELFF